MRIKSLAVVVAVAALTVALGACAPTAPVTTPVVMDVNALQGETVDLGVGQVLDIDTGDLAVDSYSGEVKDPSIAEFTPGREDGDATYNPGVKGLAEGSTEVVLSNSDGGIEDVTFTVKVSGD